MANNESLPINRILLKKLIRRRQKAHDLYGNYGNSKQFPIGVEHIWRAANGYYWIKGKNGASKKTIEDAFDLSNKDTSKNKKPEVFWILAELFQIHIYDLVDEDLPHEQRQATAKKIWFACKDEAHSSHRDYTYINEELDNAIIGVPDPLHGWDFDGVEPLAKDRARHNTKTPTDSLPSHDGEDTKASMVTKNYGNKPTATQQNAGSRARLFTLPVTICLIVLGLVITTFLIVRSFSGSETAHQRDPDPGKGALPSLVSKVDLALALEVIEKIKNERSYAHSGQHEAIPLLIGQGHTFENSDFSGTAFDGAYLSNGQFSNSTFKLSNLNGIKADNMDFSGGILDFISMDNAEIIGSNLSQAIFRFAHINKALFDTCNLQHSNFTMADLRGSSFRNSNLTGTTFAFADLRGCDFEGADLTGAHLVGVMLDDASFDGAIIRDTDFTSAIADNIKLTQIQKEGIRRARSDRGTQHTIQFSVQVEKRIPKDHEAGYSIDNIVWEKWTMRNHFASSFPIRLAIYENPPNYDPYTPGTLKIRIDSALLKSPGAEKEIRQRVQNHCRMIHSMATPDRMLEGDYSQVKEWAKKLELATQSQTTPIASPFLDDDVMVLHLLKHNLLDDNRADWTGLCGARYYDEKDIRQHLEGDFKSWTMWPPIFPQNIALGDFPKNAPELYRNWCKRRAPNMPDKLTCVAAMCQKKKVDGSVQSIKIHLHGIYQRPYKKEKYQGLVWQQHNLSTNEKKVSLRTNIKDMGFNELSLVFDKPLHDYSVMIPAGVIQKAWQSDQFLRAHVDLVITSIKLSDNKRNCYVHVRPDGLRVLNDKAASLWKGDFVTAKDKN